MLSPPMWNLTTRKTYSSLKECSSSRGLPNLKCFAEQSANQAPPAAQLRPMEYNAELEEK